MRVIVGAALDSLPTLEAEEPFDLVFIDADRESNPEYVRWVVRLAHPGTVIVVDNVVRRGAVGAPATANTQARAGKCSR
ncbi:O-methyltransferase [Rhodococcus tukisamuensis]|uniref:O-methyltransferase n=1 Tax=Rhodococcus tukisamuensis TaxID=168276 RepID=A0A1G6R912_9NOCA|nr:O-methyltransferase [Rhodococcus tukisamuensis]